MIGATSADRLGYRLSLAATPVFAVMALLTAITGDGSADLLCSSNHGAALLGGMAPMYGLMSAFHATPWIRLASRRRPRGTVG